MDDIIGVIDEGLARRSTPVVCTGEPLTGDQLVAALDALPPKTRAQPLLVSLADRAFVVIELRDAVLRVEEVPF